MLAHSRNCLVKSKNKKDKIFKFIPSILFSAFPVFAVALIGCGERTTPRAACEKVMAVMGQETEKELKKASVALSDDLGFAQEESIDACTIAIEKRSSDCQDKFSDLGNCIEEHGVYSRNRCKEQDEEASRACYLQRELPKMMYFRVPDMSRVGTHGKKATKVVNFKDIESGNWR